MSEKRPKLEIIQIPAQGAGSLCDCLRSPGRCFPVQQRGSGRHHTTARKKWSKEVHIVVMECRYRLNPIVENGVPLEGYRQ